MLTTSVCLPEKYARLWRKQKRRIMKHALAILRRELRRNSVKRGVTRKYNRLGQPTTIVTTRFTSKEYDALHFVAASVRTSVSLLVYLMIKMWLKKARRKRRFSLAAEYEIQVLRWNSDGAILTESLIFASDQSRPDFTLHGVQ